MKKITLLVATLLTLGLSLAAFAQTAQSTTVGAPQAIKYQAVARNSNGDAIANQPVSFRISIVEGSANGTTVYEETQISTTNQFGLANLNIGNGTAVTGAFNGIDWSKGNYFVKVEFDPKGGDNFTYMGTSEMLSVPYSLYAEHAKTADNMPTFPVKAALQGTNLQAPFDAPATGTLVYNTDSAGTGDYAVIPGYYYNAGTAIDPNWVMLSVSDDSQTPIRRYHAACISNTSYGGAMLGSNAASATCAMSAATITTGADNSAFGYDALDADIDGSANTAMGYNAMLNNTACGDNVAVGNNSLYTQNYNPGGGNNFYSQNTAVGYDALYFTNPTATTNAEYNLAAGAYAGYTNSTGSNLVALGASALYYNTIGNGNTAIGEAALQDNTTANYNTAVGQDALYLQAFSNTSSNWNSYNTAVGYQALYSNAPSTNASTTQGIENTAQGAFSGYTNSTGSYNTSDGYEALYSNTSGVYNTAIGMQASIENTTGIHNTSEGYGSYYENVTGSGNTSLGYSSLFGVNGDSYSWNTAIGDSAMYSTTTGYHNTAVGYRNMGSITSGARNTSVGDYAGYTITTAFGNTSIGYNALYTNSTGLQNTAVGDSALYNNTATGNTATGYAALYTNSSGTGNTADGYQALLKNAATTDNTAMGYQALYTNNTTGSNNNTAVGYQALYNNASNGNVTSNTAVGYQASYSNTTGINNSALGYYALGACTQATGNTAVGYNALKTVTTSSDNTAIGWDADVSTTSISNATAIGYQATATASNTIYLGNSSVTGIYCASGLYTTSDGRFKSDVEETVPGLSFITKLRPVTYHYNMDAIAQYIHTPDSLRLKESEAEKGKMLFSGFIAQEVEKTANDCGYDFNGVSKPKNTNDYYAIDYAAFTVPLVKAVQEQQQIIDSLKTVIAIQSAKTTADSKDQSIRLTNDEKEIAELKQMIQNMSQAQASIKQ